MNGPSGLPYVSVRYTIWHECIRIHTQNKVARNDPANCALMAALVTLSISLKPSVLIAIPENTNTAPMAVMYIMDSAAV